MIRYNQMSTQPIIWYASPIVNALRSQLELIQYQMFIMIEDNNRREICKMSYGGAKDE